MITTREIDVNLKKGNLKHRQVTTKNINAGVRVEPPKEPIKSRSVTTATLPDVADIAEKKKRDDIMAEKVAFEKGDAVYQDEKGKLIVKEKPEKSIKEIAKEAGVKIAKEANIEKMNIRHVFVEIDGLIQAVSRRDLK